MPKREPASARTMTVRDWKVLYLVQRLGEQIILHGAGALDTFIDAMVELRAADAEGGRTHG